MRSSAPGAGWRPWAAGRCWTRPAAPWWRASGALLCLSARREVLLERLALEAGTRPLLGGDSAGASAWRTCWRCAARITPLSPAPGYLGAGPGERRARGADSPGRLAGERDGRGLRRARAARRVWMAWARCCARASCAARWRWSATPTWPPCTRRAPRRPWKTAGIRVQHGDAPSRGGAQDDRHGRRAVGGVPVRRAGARQHGGGAGRRGDRRSGRLCRGHLPARGALGGCCPPRCWRWRMPAWAARPAPTCRRAKTWSGPFTRPRWSWLTRACWPACRKASSAAAWPRWSSTASWRTRPSLNAANPAGRLCRRNWDEIVRRAVAVKIGFIQADPYEKGIRAALNLGHTVGHAVELASGFRLRHGEAVAIGLAGRGAPGRTAGHHRGRAGRTHRRLPVRAGPADRDPGLDRRRGLPARAQGG